MEYRQRAGEIEVRGVREFDLMRIFDCGQCFRWNPDGDGAYLGVAMGRAARVRRQGESIFISGTTKEFQTVWRDYFDLDRDYESIRRALRIDGYMAAAADFGVGIRILRQDRWEALCSFIISQCNNIPRIKQIIESLCRAFGEPVALDGRTFYTFPSAERLASLGADDLAPLRCGYRAPYIVGAARAVAEGKIDLAGLSEGTAGDAVTALRALDGVGEKVASCAVLFGLHMLDAFPADVWIRRTLADHYGKDFDPSVFSPYAGVAQQYMYYYARSGERRGA